MATAHDDSTRKVRTYQRHRAGPPETDLWEDKLIAVQRCLRCDDLLAVDGDGKYPIKTGARVETDEICIGEIPA